MAMLPPESLVQATTMMRAWRRAFIAGLWSWLAVVMLVGLAARGVVVTEQLCGEHYTRLHHGHRYPLRKTVNGWR